MTGAETASAANPRSPYPLASVPHFPGDSGLIRIIRETAANSGYRVTSLGPGELILEKGNLWLSIIFGAIAVYTNFRVRVTHSPPTSQYIAIERNTPWWSGVLGVLNVRSQFKAITTAIADAVYLHGGEVIQRATHGRNVGLTVSIGEFGESGTTGSPVCPSCAEIIKPGARVCRYCGHQFSDQDVQVARQAGVAAAGEREARFEASRRQQASEKARKKAAVCNVFGWIFAAFWALFVIASFGAYFTGSKGGDGQPMTFGGLIGGLVCFTIPFGLPGLLLLLKARKHKEESRALLSDA